ncbi:acyloxyacyl hydrolase [Corallincola luteus]|uniref:Acyloxyacyl hydrolase n=2 Tax=Corallincola luteus TaxID=1775177 RepID=A0ABY2AL79_9GAMM|nr:acyloxyacyl hydrolase [Corallincola luteus]
MFSMVTSSRLGLIALMGLLFAPMSQADTTEEFPLLGLGAKYGIDDFSDGHDIENQAVYANLGTPWDWQVSDNIRMDTEVQSTLGRYKVDEDYFGYLMFGVDLRFQYADFPVVVKLGTAPTYLFDDESEEFDAGGPLHMTTHLTVLANPVKWLDIGVTYQHTSNAGTNKENPGIDVLSLDVSYRF